MNIFEWLPYFTMVDIHGREVSKTWVFYWAGDDKESGPCKRIPIELSKEKK